MKKILLFILLCNPLLPKAQTLTNGQVYDYLPGDVFQWTFRDIHDMGGPGCYLPSTLTYHTDSVLSKSYSTASDTVFYSIHTTEYTPVQCNPTLPPYYHSYISQLFYTNLNSPADSGLYIYGGSCTAPEDSFYTGQCGRNIWDHFSTEDTMCFENPIWKFTFIEGCGAYENYHGGYGGEPHFEETLTYYKKSGVACGTNTSVGIKENFPNGFASISPNPTQGQIELHYSFKASPGNLIIYDLQGELIGNYWLEKESEGRIRIDLSALNNGIYFYKVVADKKVIVSDKLIIIR